MPPARDDALHVSYQVRSSSDQIAGRADALLLEQTVELPRSAAARHPWVARHILGSVESIQEVGPDLHRVTLAQPMATVGADPAQLLNVLFGNASLQPEVVLIDVELPLSAFDWLPGPRLGLAGLRRLVGVADRPLLATALKPMGLDPAQLAELCGGFARAGLDLIKDDHGLADHAFCPFRERVAACLRAVDEVARETGRRPLYVPNLIGPPDRILEQLAFAREAGARAVMVSPMVVGLPFLATLAAMADGLPVIAHPAFGGVIRAEPPVLFGRLFRWFGADAVIYPHAGGRFSYTPATCQALAAALRADHPRARSAFPVPAGGIKLERVTELLQFYGRDCILLIGGSLYDAGARLFERARALAEQVARVASAEPAA